METAVTVCLFLSGVVVRYPECLFKPGWSWNHVTRRDGRTWEIPAEVFVSLEAQAHAFFSHLGLLQTRWFRSTHRDPVEGT